MRPLSFFLFIKKFSFWICIFNIYLCRRLLQGFVFFLAAWANKIMTGFNCPKTKSEFWNRSFHNILWACRLERLETEVWGGKDIYWKYKSKKGKIKLYSGMTRVNMILYTIYGVIMEGVFQCYTAIYPESKIIRLICQACGLFSIKGLCFRICHPNLSAPRIQILTVS